ncbi:MULTISPECIES: LLM class flavin-dependent oxidoreductase [Nostocales]|uniref:LLM class flavin-dependent oxidoreductase n=3 Tax=Nostocales TaxID=1161 RepID=A0A0C1R413_9CYAN|nr:LLM class flavin-dependent oxidoreductase [Tolypothrix bouteillei]KAF3889549.1 LLM class flavin-dependent oxidoreductase [Tolypothrix bouteillei VB521301]
MTDRHQLHLNLLFNNAGNYSSAWRWPDSDPGAFADIQYYVRTAQLCERGTFDAIFLADHPALGEYSEYRPFQSLEPTIALAAVASATERIGLIATASTTYNEPYNIARRFATLDRVSGGRVGWNVVTTANPEAAYNFGQTDVISHDTRYERAGEFTEVVQALWDSWEDDAFIGDKASARFIDPSRVHPINHKGKYFSVQGPLNVPRSPQGRPVLVQAGGSDDGRDLAAKYAEVVFTAAQSLPQAVAYSNDLRNRARKFGRSPDAIVILPGLVTVIGSTEAEAKRREQELWELVPIEYGLGRLANILQVEPEVLKLDERLPENLPLPVNSNQTMFKVAVDVARRGNLTVRELIKALGGGGTMHRIVVGTPEQVADSIEEWFLSGAVGGFNVVPDAIASGLEVFVDFVVPELRRRGIFRTEYKGRTLREHYGLERPQSRYARENRQAVPA